MHPRPTIPSFGLALRLAFPLALLFLTPACQTSPDPSTNASHSEPTATDTSAPATLPLATLGPDPLWPRDLAPALSEAAGALVLEELILDRSLALALRRAGLTITRADIERERTLLIDTIASDSGTDGNAAARSLNAIRAQRGLGPARFEALLSRNAGLRALARSEADTRRAAATTRTGEGAQAAATEDAFRTFLDQEFGGKVRARVIVLPTADAATRLRDRILTESARATQPAAEDGETSMGAGRWLDVIRHRRADFPDPARLYPPEVAREPAALDNTRRVLLGLRARGYRLAVADLAPGAIGLDQAPLDQALALVIGNEFTGPSPVALELADLRLVIPMRGLAQSLNLSVFAGIALHALSERMRSQPGWGLTAAEQAELVRRWSGSPA